MSIAEHVPDGTFVNEIAALVHPQPEVFETYRSKVVVAGGEILKEYDDPKAADPVTINVSTLSAVAHFVKSAHDLAEEVGPLVVHVSSPDIVRVITPCFGTERQQFVYMVARASVPQSRLGNFLAMDEFIVSLMTGFVLTEERASVQKFAGSLKAGLAAEIRDDGVTQTVNAASGVTRVGQPQGFANPIVLQPFRSFAEIEQPDSPFILRLQQVKNGDNLTAMAALFEADGGAWRTEAIRRIAEWLRIALGSETVILA